MMGPTTPPSGAGVGAGKATLMETVDVTVGTTKGGRSGWPGVG